MSATTTTEIKAHAISLRGSNAEEHVGTLTITPIIGDQHFGAEVTGLNWAEPIPVHQVQELIALQDKYAVLIFRNTGLDNARHIAFSQQLGRDLEINPFFYGRENDRVGEPFLWDVGNIEKDGSIVKPNSRRWHHSLGNALWHTDSSYHQRRSKYSLLLAHGAGPSSGSCTHFADTRAAYADLPDEKKMVLEDLIVEHNLWHSRKLASPQVYGTPTLAELAAKPPACHRLVQVAPSGEKTLYLAAHAKRIIGMSEDESQRLIWELINWCTQPKYVFSMDWQSSGDMVWWDNRQSMHRADPYWEGMGARDVRRSTVIDDGPWANGESKPSAAIL